MPIEQPCSREDGVLMRQPGLNDGAAIWRLVIDAGTLDRNAGYTYLLLCRDFAETCVVAERDGILVGCVTGYRPPKQPDTIFVWQVAVSPSARGEGIAGSMLDWLLSAEGCRGVRFLETTVTPSNTASRAMFASLAERLDAALEESAGFLAELFPDADHENEPQLRIGPFEVTHSPV